MSNTNRENQELQKSWDLEEEMKQGLQAIMAVFEESREPTATELKHEITGLLEIQYKAMQAAHDFAKSFADHSDIVTGFWSSTVLDEKIEAIEALLSQHSKKRELEYQEIFKWLLGEGGDFPLSEPGKRYNWRSELRERISKLTNGEGRDEEKI